MSIGMILLLLVVVVVVVIVLFYFFRPQTYIDRFNAMFDNFINGSSKNLSEDVISNLGLGKITEIGLEGIEIHYKYKIENAEYNRVVIIVVDEKSNAYLNNNHVNKLLENKDGVRSLVGFSKANSGSEMIKIVCPKDDSISDPRVYLGSANIEPRSPKAKQSSRVEQIEDDILMDI